MSEQTSGVVVPAAIEQVIEDEGRALYVALCRCDGEDMSLAFAAARRVAEAALLAGAAQERERQASEELPATDTDVPIETRRELMECAVQNGRISYYYLCDVFRRGRLARCNEIDWSIAQLRAQATRVLAGDSKDYGEAKALARFVIAETDDILAACTPPTPTEKENNGTPTMPLTPEAER